MSNCFFHTSNRKSNRHLKLDLSKTKLLMYLFPPHHNVLCSQTSHLSWRHLSSSVSERNHGVILDTSYFIFLISFNPSLKCIEMISKLSWESNHFESPIHHPSWVINQITRLLKQLLLWSLIPSCPSHTILNLILMNIISGLLGVGWGWGTGGATGGDRARPWEWSLGVACAPSHTPWDQRLEVWVLRECSQSKECPPELPGAIVEDTVS